MQPSCLHEWLYGEQRDTERSEVFMSKVDREKYPDIKQEYRFEKVD